MQRTLISRVSPHRSSVSPTTMGPEQERAEQERAEQERAEVAGQPSAEAAAEAAHTEPWPLPHRPWRLCTRPYTRPLRWHRRPWPPWPWHQPQPPARPGPEPVRRPAWPPPASPPASSTSSTYLPPLAREFVPIGGGPSEREDPPPTKSDSLQELSLSYYGLVVPG